MVESSSQGWNPFILGQQCHIWRKNSRQNYRHNAFKPIIKFIYSEKVTKFCEISTLLLTGTKGQIISKGLLVSSNLKRMFLLLRPIRLLVFRENSRTPKSPFEIIWPVRVHRTKVRWRFETLLNPQVYERKFNAKAIMKSFLNLFTKLFFAKLSISKNSWNPSSSLKIQIANSNWIWPHCVKQAAPRDVGWKWKFWKNSFVKL